MLVKKEAAPASRKPQATIYKAPMLKIKEIVIKITPVEEKV